MPEPNEVYQTFSAVFSMAFHRVLHQDGWDLRHVDTIYNGLLSATEAQHIPSLRAAYNAVKTQLIAHLEEE
jgi:hypothetical protein